LVLSTLINERGEAKPGMLRWVRAVRHGNAWPVRVRRPGPPSRRSPARQQQWWTGPRSGPLLGIVPRVAAIWRCRSVCCGNLWNRALRRRRRKARWVFGGSPRGPPPQSGVSRLGEALGGGCIAPASALRANRFGGKVGSGPPSHWPVHARLFSSRRTTSSFGFGRCAPCHNIS